MFLVIDENEAEIAEELMLQSFDNSEMIQWIQNLSLSVDKIELSIKNAVMELEVKRAKDTAQSRSNKISDLERVISEMSKKLYSPR